MFLYLARHAWAGHHGDPGWPDDSLRELTPKGAKRFAKLVKTLADRGFEPARIATSPYARCRQTADIIAKHTPAEPPIDELDALAPGSDLRELIRWTASQEGGDVCWVGHNPDIQRLAAALLGAPNAGVRFAKGAVCAIQFDEPLSADDPSAGELYWHVTAKVLGV